MNWAIFAVFATMVVCFLIRMPISFSMLTSSIVYFLIKAPAQLGQVATVLTGNMFANYTMLAAPLFIFMANVLNESDITDRMFSFCNGLLGRLKGGTAHKRGADVVLGGAHQVHGMDAEAAGEKFQTHYVCNENE